MHWRHGSIGGMVEGLVEGLESMFWGLGSRIEAGKYDPLSINELKSVLNLKWCISEFWSCATVQQVGL